MENNDTELRKKIEQVCGQLHNDYRVAQAKSNAALARYKRAKVELEEM